VGKKLGQQFSTYPLYSTVLYTLTNLPCTCISKYKAIGSQYKTRAPDFVEFDSDKDLH